MANRIHVIAAGFLTTVQDLGRYGYAHLGISPAGAADALSLRIGNRLVGNVENTAALEMTLVGGTFEFESDAEVALAGSDFGAPLWTPLEIESGQRLQLGPTRSGARCYLCIRGGIEAPLVLGSASTHLLTGLGGRALRKGDVLQCGNAGRARHASPLQQAPCQRDLLRVTSGPQSDWFSDDFYRATYQVTEESNRMGLRLSGPKLGHSREMLTEGVSVGAIQVPPGGQPIILFVEHPTTGGYPKIANVISADRHVLGQLRPRDEVRFERVSIEQALALLREQEELIHSVV